MSLKLFENKALAKQIRVKLVQMNGKQGMLYLSRIFEFKAWRYDLSWKVSQVQMNAINQDQIFSQIKQLIIFIFSYKTITMQTKQSLLPEVNSLQPQVQPRHFKSSFKQKYYSNILMLLSTFAWVGGYIYSNQNNFSPIMTNSLRGVMIMTVSLFICIYQNQSLSLQKQYRIVWIRNLIFLFQQFIMAAIQFYIPLGLLHTLGATGPIFVYLISFIIHKSKPTSKEYLSITLTLFGVALTANGNLISKVFNDNYEFQSDFHNYKSREPFSIAVSCFVFVFFLVFWAYGVHSTSQIKASTYVVNFLFGLKLFLVSSILYPYIKIEVQPIKYYKGLLYTGAISVISQTLFVLSLKTSINLGLTTMLGSFSIVVGYLFSILRYDQEINGICLIGSVMIIGGLGKLFISS